MTSEERGPNASMAIVQPKTTTISGVRQEVMGDDDAGPATDMDDSFALPKIWVLLGYRASRGDE